MTIDYFFGLSRKSLSETSEKKIILSDGSFLSRNIITDIVILVIIHDLYLDVISRSLKSVFE